MKKSHFKTVFVFTLLVATLPASAAETAPGNGGVPTGASEAPPGKPMIHIISGPTRKAKTAEEASAEQQKQMAELQQLLQAMGVDAGPGQPNQIVNANGNYAEVAGPGEGNFTAHGGGDGKPVQASQLSGSAKIIKPFQYWFDKCSADLGMGSCKFINMGIEPDAAHRARRSCHNSGEAIDVGPLTCSNGSSKPGDEQFLKMADCMANSTNNVLQVIYFRSTGGNMIQKSDHTNHMHIQLKNCAMVYGGGR